MIATSAWQVAGEHIFSFGFGLVVGFLVAHRYRIVRIVRERRDTDELESE
jgi:hypothetical protein